LQMLVGSSINKERSMPHSYITTDRELACSRCGRRFYAEI